jgi:hypothetical protein
MRKCDIQLQATAAKNTMLSLFSGKWRKLDHKFRGSYTKYGLKTLHLVRFIEEKSVK